MKKAVSLAILALVSILSITTVSFSTYAYNEENQLENNVKLLLNEEQFSDEEFYYELSKLSKDDIIQLGNIVSIDNNSDTNNLMPLATALAVNETNYTEHDIVSLIEDTTNNIEFRNVLVQFYAYKVDTEKNYNEEFKKMLLDNSVDDSIKISIVSTFKFNDKEDNEILKELVMDENIELSNIALKRLKNIDENTAKQISFQILDNYENEDSERVKNALNVYSALYDDEDTINMLSEEDSFQDFCITLLNDSNYSETAAFALGNLYDYEAVKSVITSDVDFLTKVCVIDQNYSILLDKLYDDINENDFNIILDAMEILPINEFYDPIKEIVVSDTIENNMIKEKGNKILEVIQSVGVSANEKWND